MNSLFDRLAELTLPAGSYALFGSAPLAVRGIVPLTNDLDVLCLPEAWERVLELGETEYLPEYDVTIVSMFNGAITFGTRWGIGDVDVAELIRTADIIDGLPFVRLEHVVRYKQIRASEKDLAHLERLAKYRMDTSK